MRELRFEALWNNLRPPYQILHLPNYSMGCVHVTCFFGLGITGAVALDVCLAVSRLRSSDRTGDFSHTCIDYMLLEEGTFFSSNQNSLLTC